MGLFASGMSISLPLYYQTGERLEEKKSFVKLIDKNSSYWAELWELIIKRFSEVTLKMPDLLKPLEKVNLEHLKETLNAIVKANSVWRNNTGTIISGKTAELHVIFFLLP